MNSGNVQAGKKGGMADAISCRQQGNSGKGGPDAFGSTRKKMQRAWVSHWPITSEGRDRRHRHRHGDGARLLWEVGYSEDRWRGGGAQRLSAPAG